MSEAYAVSTKVEWNWGNGKGSGKAREVYREKFNKAITGSEVTRDADNDHPA